MKNPTKETKKSEGVKERTSLKYRDRRREESLSYVDVTGRKKQMKDGEKEEKKDDHVLMKRQQEKKKEWTGLEFESSEEDRKWANRGLVGIVNHPEE
ncbi:hypothetical protein A2U01_0060827, partial [Trifolium medium]|nr:hypothetical protein [Trifolium medium]